MSTTEIQNTVSPFAAAVSETGELLKRRLLITRKAFIPPEGKPKNYLKSRLLLSGLKTSFSEAIIENRNNEPV